jgi:hypothetical protein
MKKSILLLAVLFSLSFISCTDNLAEDESINEQIELTDKGNVGSPGNDGGDDEDSDD